MGYLNALDMAGAADFSAAFRWHMTSNHFPPYASEFIEAIEQTALKAVTCVRNGLPHDILRMPAGVEFRNRKQATAGEIIESLHLWAFVDTESGNWTMEDADERDAGTGEH
jgi:hypothetical protein